MNFLGRLEAAKQRLIERGNFPDPSVITDDQFRYVPSWFGVTVTFYANSFGSKFTEFVGYLF